VIISDLQEGIFFSRLVCSNEQDTVEIDSRTSDALALAVRFGCPIFTFENILENAGMLLDDTGTKKKGSKMKQKVQAEEPGTREDLHSMPLEDLNTLLNEVLEQEDYLRAISIRDEIKRRTIK
jgi:bifunctional DNase/RNase